MRTRIRLSSLIMLIVGVLLMAAALIVRFVILPIGSKLPSDLSLSLTYTGKGTALNPQALQSGDVAHALVPNAPFNVDRKIKVVSTSGNTAIVHDDITLGVVGQPGIPTKHVYAVDRTSMRGVDPPKGVTAEHAKGSLVLAWPISPHPDNRYRAYESNSQTIVGVKYLGRTTQSGKAAYIYGYSASGPLKNPELLAALPKALPKSTVGLLAKLLPANLVAKLAPLAPTLPDPVPMSYLVQTTIKGYVDQHSGLPMNEFEDVTVIAQLNLPGNVITLRPVLTVAAKLTPDSIKTAVDKANTADVLLTLIGVVIPLVAGLLGVLLVVVAFLRRRPKQASGSVLSTAVPVPHEVDT